MDTDNKGKLNRFALIGSWIVLIGVVLIIFAIIIGIGIEPPVITDMEGRVVSDSDIYYLIDSVLDIVKFIFLIIIFWGSIFSIVGIIQIRLKRKRGIHEEGLRRSILSLVPITVFLILVMISIS
ncbi:MAG: hypothetical protein ABH833_02990 [Parcubacteria group bacterium]